MAMPPKTASIPAIIKIIEGGVLVTAHSCLLLFASQVQWRPLKRSRRKRKCEDSASCLEIFFAKDRLHVGKSAIV
jgi:hypothetical protein